MLIDAPERYGVMGVPIDKVEMQTVIDRIDSAVISRARLLISTVNTNFLIASQAQAPFRNSLLESDICTVDGVGVLLICRMLAIDISSRVAGSDILDHLCTRTASRLGRPLRLFFLGGQLGVAEAAAAAINARASATICCVGALNPGFGDMDELSRPEVIDAINAAHPDFLVVSLGAERGQAWLQRNASRLEVPVRSHLGAAVNFLAGTVQRAPRQWQALGLEWLWRIKEEPALWSRYLSDAWALCLLLLVNILPVAVMRQWERHVAKRRGTLQISLRQIGSETHIVLRGAAIAAQTPAMREQFKQAQIMGADVVLDLNGIDAIDAAGIGQILRLRADLAGLGLKLWITGVLPKIARRLRLEAVAWLC